MRVGHRQFINDESPISYLSGFFVYSGKLIFSVGLNMWQTSMTWEVAKSRANFIANLRHFFEGKGVVEVETPLLCQGTITDVHLDSFVTQYDYLPEGVKPFYLQTSPEFAMKRLLCSGYQSIYQICKAFRHEDSGRIHNAEFTMLEWYRIDYGIDQLMSECAELIETLLQCDKCSFMTYQDAFLAITHIDPLTCELEVLKQYLLQENKLDDWLIDEQDIDTLLQFIFAEFIEKDISNESPVFIYNFPSSQASLAKISSIDHRVAERFECYYKGIELVNGFHELNDADAQYQRFKMDNAKRMSKGLQEKPIDHLFLEALSAGLPECSGVALGVDRLFMLSEEICSIKDVITFPIENA